MSARCRSSRWYGPRRKPDAPLRPVLGSLPARVAGVLAGLVLHSLTAHAQDFEPAAPAGPAASPAAFLERALAPRGGFATIEAAIARWSALDDFSTRAASASAGWGAARIAAGLSSSGDGEIGWNGVAMAGGFASLVCGLGVRVIARRDRSSAMVQPGRAVGIETGAGFWSALGDRATVWASVPTLVAGGEAPPLDRGIESGVRMSFASAAGWVGWEVPGRAAEGAERIAGAAVGAEQLQVWIEARDRPLRATLGLSLRRGALQIATAVNEHPVLGETVRVALSLRRAAAVPAGGSAP